MAAMTGDHPVAAILSDHRITRSPDHPIVSISRG